MFCFMEFSIAPRLLLRREAASAVCLGQIVLPCVCALLPCLLLRLHVCACALLPSLRLRFIVLPSPRSFLLFLSPMFLLFLAFPVLCFFWTVYLARGLLWNWQAAVGRQGRVLVPLGLHAIAATFIKSCFLILAC